MIYTSFGPFFVLVVAICSRHRCAISVVVGDGDGCDFIYAR
jgi:hypothetical protein